MSNESMEYFMKTTDVVKYFKGKSKAASALKLGCIKSIYSNWGEYPPIARQWQIELLTNGELKSESYYDGKIPSKLKFVKKLSNDEKNKLLEMLLDK